MRVLTVPNWSFFDPELCSSAIEDSCSKVALHYAKGDVDHLRTVTAFSGEAVNVLSALDSLCERFLPSINLGVGGVHPFAGALDVVPFVGLDESGAELVELCRSWAAYYSSRFGVPVHLYEKAAFSGNENRLPVLRGQLGGINKSFDFGTARHPHWGYSVVGVREFLLAVNLNFDKEEIQLVRRLAKQIRLLREAGDDRFSGVRALAFTLEQQQFAQLSMNLTLPDCTSIDDICCWLDTQTDIEYETELIGVIRDVDLPKSTRLTPQLRQIVPTL